MTEFIGAEYLIARMLIEKNEPEISTMELNRLGICVRKLSFEEETNVVFLTSREEVYSAIYDYSDYFKCVYDGNGKITAIQINENKSMDDLTVKFMRYLPENITKILDKAIEEINAA